MKKTTSLLILLAMTATAQAVPLISDSATYDFSGTLEDHFTAPFVPDAGVQQNGRLEFHNSNASSGESGTFHIHNSFRPRYDQSWTASLDLSLPLAYTTLDGVSPQSGDEWLSTGLYVAFDPNNDNNPERVFYVSLDLGRRPDDSTYRGLFVSNTGVSTFVNTPLGTVRVRIDFDAETKEFSAFQGTMPLDTTGIMGTGGWNMADADTFKIAIAADAMNEPADPQNPLSLDNFSASLVPEPTTLLLSLLGLAGWGQRRHR